MWCARNQFKIHRSFSLGFKSIFNFSETQNHLSKKALCILSNRKIADCVLKANWEEALILVEQSKILNHAYDKTTCFLEALTYQLAYNRTDKVEQALKNVTNEEDSAIVEAYLKALLQMIQKLQTHDELYKMDKKEFNRIIEVIQEILE